MDLKGYDKFREKLPKYSGKRIAILGLLIITIGIVSLISMIFVDSLARIYSQISFLVLVEPILPIIGALIIQLTAFRLIWRVWHNKDKYLAELGELAYQRALPQGFAGVSLVVAVCFHIYIPLGSSPLGDPANPITTNFSESFLALLGLPLGLDILLRICGCVFFIILGMLTVRSALFTFGIDYMGLVYLYYPEESEIQQHEIYSVLRHPTYFALLSFAIGGACLNLSFFSVVFFLIFLLGLLAHILLVEEKELEERFGQAFIEYRESVPALHVRFRDLRIYFRFLLRRK